MVEYKFLVMISEDGKSETGNSKIKIISV